MYEPYKFQQEAVDKLSKPKVVSRLLGDDMGLGKTPTALWIDKENRLAHYREHGRSGPRLKTLIIGSSIILQDAWEPWIKRIAPNARVVICNPKNRAEFIRLLKDPNIHYYLVHWAGVRLIKELQQVNWFHVIADEAHAIKNRKAQTTRALKAIKTQRKTAVTGTPAEDKPPDLWSIVNWLWPSYYKSYWKFVDHYCVVEVSDNWGNSTAYRKVVGIKNARSLLAEMEPWYVRRRKEEVLTDLPDIIHDKVWVDISLKQRKAYNEMRDEMITWLGTQDDQVMVAPIAIAKLTRLQQFALATMEWDESQGKWRMCDPSSKLDALMAIIEGNPGVPIVVFTQFKTMVRLLEERLAKAKISCIALTGDVPQSERGKLVSDFQDGKYQIFATTIATGSEGITLTRSSTEVFLDRAWQPSKNQQAESRCHRIGQKDAVQVIDIMAKDTIDLPRHAHIELKLKWLRQLLGEDN